MNIILYKLNSQLQIQFWQVYTSGTDVCVAWGVMQETSAGPKFPLSPQLKTEPFPDVDSAIRKAESLAAEKQGRKGYTLTIPKSVPVLPMLAQDFTSDSQLPVRLACQPKLDGFRCIGSNKGLKSRLNTRINSAPLIEEALKALPDGLKLDGELYIHGVDLQTISSYVKRDKPHPLHSLIEYHVFDIVDIEATFFDRVLQLETIPLTHKISFEGTKIKVVPTSVCVSYDSFTEQERIKYQKEFLTDKFKKAIVNGYEGLILRDLDGVYELNKRSKYLLKYKERMSDEFQIINVEEVKDGCCIFVCKTNGVTTDVSIKATRLRKQQIWQNRERYIGQWAKIEFQKVLPGGRLFQPVCVDIYEKKEDAK